MVDLHPNALTTEHYTRDGEPGAPWTQALDTLGSATTFWVATAHPTGRPHVVPVLAVVLGGDLHFAAGPTTQKARNLAHDPRIALTTHGDDFDVVVEGVAEVIRDDDSLAAVAAAYCHKYGWQVEIRDGSLHGDGAPTAGPPPYAVYRLVADRAFGFPTTGAATPSRWRFRAA